MFCCLKQGDSADSCPVCLFSHLVAHLSNPILSEYYLTFLVGPSWVLGSYWWVSTMPSLAWIYYLYSSCWCAGRSQWPPLVSGPCTVWIWLVQLSLCSVALVYTMFCYHGFIQLVEMYVMCTCMFFASATMVCPISQTFIHLCCMWYMCVTFNLISFYSHSVIPCCTV
jgi:hypothetical protein